MKNAKEIIARSNYLFPALVLLSFVTLIKLILSQELCFEINETGHAFFEPNLDVDSSVHFIAVWDDYCHCPEYCGEEGGAAIYVQRFDTNGVNKK